MDKRKLILTAGGASIVATALAMNIGTAAAEGCEQVVACDGGGGDFSPMQKIDSVIAKISSRFDKSSPVVQKLESVVVKLDEISSGSTEQFCDFEGGSPTISGCLSTPAR